MRIAILPPVPALLPSYAGQDDPVAELRSAARAAAAWAADGADVGVLHDPLDDVDLARGIATPVGLRIAESLLPQGVSSSAVSSPGLLVMANGSARRTEKAPGHLDPRALGFDAELGAVLAAGDAAALASLDLALGDELLASGLNGLASLANRVVTSVEVDYAADPFGVMYWVVRWTCAS